MRKTVKMQNKAQGLLAYMIFIAVIAGALITMKFFLQRTVQEKYRQSSDVWGEGEQYEPNRTTGGMSGSTWKNRKELCPEAEAKMAGLTAALSNLFQRIQKLLYEIEDLEGRAVALESRAADAQAQADRLREELLIPEALEVEKIIKPLKDEAKKLTDQAKKRKEKIKTLNEEIKNLQKKIQQLKDFNPDCF